MQFSLFAKEKKKEVKKTIPVIELVYNPYRENEFGKWYILDKANNYLPFFGNYRDAFKLGMYHRQWLSIKVVHESEVEKESLNEYMYWLVQFKFFKCNDYDFLIAENEVLKDRRIYLSDTTKLIYYGRV